MHKVLQRLAIRAYGLGSPAVTFTTMWLGSKAAEARVVSANSTASAKPRVSAARRCILVVGLLLCVDARCGV